MEKIKSAIDRKVENDAKRNANMRHVFGYRSKDGSLCDNLVCIDYMNILDAVNVLKLNCLMAFSRAQMLRLSGVDVVRLGVWQKGGKSMSNKFISLKSPEYCFTLGEELFKEFDKLHGDK